MKKVGFIFGLIILVLLDSCIESNQKNNVKENISIAKSNTPIKLCGKCGEIKGSENCCSKDAAKCDKCGLIKGSPGCCKISSDTLLCTICGEIKGSKNCCSKDAVKCDKCGLIKGAPGCCKMNN